MTSFVRTETVKHTLLREVKRALPVRAHTRGAMTRAQRFKTVLDERRAKGSTVVELARLCHVSKQTIHAWARNDTTQIKADNLAAFCHHTGYNSRWLMHGKGAPKGLRSDPVTEQITAILAQLDDSQKLRVLRYMQFEQQGPPDPPRSGDGGGLHRPFVKPT